MIPNNLFAFFPKSASHTDTKDTFNSGMIKLKKVENKVVNVANRRTTLMKKPVFSICNSVPRDPIKIPDRMPSNSLANRPNFNCFIVVFPP